MKVIVAGQGAFGTRHLEAMQAIEGIEVVSLTGGRPESTEAVARKFEIPHWTSNLTESLAQPGVEAAILASPTQVHAAQAEEVMRAGKHLLVEIPMTDTLADAERLVQIQKETGVVAMAGHVRRFNPSHQWMRNKIAAGELTVQHLDMQTFFFCRTNMNASARRGAGPTTCSGTTRATRLISSSIRPVRSHRSHGRSRGRSTPSWGSRWT